MNFRTTKVPTVVSSDQGCWMEDPQEQKAAKQANQA
jgi:hypothetical protein